MKKKLKNNKNLEVKNNYAKANNKKISHQIKKESNKRLLGEAINKIDKKSELKLISDDKRCHQTASCTSPFLPKKRKKKK